MPTSEATLANLLAAVAATGWPTTRKRDCASAIRTAAKALGAEPGEIPLNVKLLRRRLDDVAPESLGMSRQRWNNVRALLNRAVELNAEVMPSAQQGPVSPAWKPLADQLPRSNWYRLSALLRFLSVRGVAPSDVTLADLDAFRHASSRTGCGRPRRRPGTGLSGAGTGLSGQWLVGRRLRSPAKTSGRSMSGPGTCFLRA